MDLRVEIGVPLYDKRKKKYPLSSMDVGDSFEVVVNKDDVRKTVSNISSACCIYAKKMSDGRKFAVRTTSETTVRCWRIM